jgi:D-alanyl-D-alanine carboxypeptidase
MIRRGFAVAAVVVAGCGGSSAAVTTTTTSVVASTTTTTVVVALPSSTDPASVAVLVNKAHGLPPGWVPPDLTVPAIPFNFAGDDPKRELRVLAARAAESLFAAAAADGVPLLGVSGYRSEKTQGDLYGLAVSRHGRAVADRSTARPGHSEHQTGLALDVAGADGRCPAEACFAGTPAAAWLAAHAHEHGFIVRYTAAKEAVTGYEPEPWHLRYVGPEVARELTTKGLALEELASQSAG